MTQMRKPASLGRGAAWMLLAALCFAGMSACVKVAASSVPNSVVVFARNAVSLLLLLPWQLRGGAAGLATPAWKDHAVRGVAGLASMVGFFFAIEHLGLAPAVLLTYSLPLYMPAIERLWLDEPISRRLWWPLAVGFSGIALVLRPGTSLFQGVAVVGFFSGVLAAVAQVGVRKLTAREPAVRIVFYFALISTAIMAVPAAAAWQGASPPALAAMVGSGVLGTVGQLFLVEAYGRAPAAQVGPFLYSVVVFSGLLDAIFWHHLPDPVFLAGAGLVVLACVLTLRLRDRRRSPPAAEAPPQASTLPSS